MSNCFSDSSVIISGNSLKILLINNIELHMKRNCADIILVVLRKTECI